MKFDELFEQRGMVASKLKDCIRDRGYTKVSFANKTGISRPTLDKLLNGCIDNKCSFDRHLQKILGVLNMSVDELLLYHPIPTKMTTATVFSKNAPMDHEMNETARKQYNLLLDVIDLCAIYY
jgi:predicted transcriptional regulator